MLAIYFKEFRDHFGMRTDDLRHRPPDPWFTDSSSSTSSTPTDDGPFLQCALCRDRYNRPKVLPCLHTFCEGCLISQTPKDSLTLTCPICRHQSILPKNGVLGLQDNLIVSSITGVLETRKEKKHYNNVSKSYSNNESIKYHRNEEKLKELPPIEENVKEQKNHLKALLTRATSHIPVLKEDINSIATVVEKLNQNHHQAKSDMFHCLEDLENTLKDKKTQLVDELDRIHKEKYDVLQQQKHLLEMCLSSLEEHCHSAEQILTDGTDEELAIVYCEMAEKLEDFVETDLQKTPVENDFVAYDKTGVTEVRGRLKCLDGVRTCRASPCESILEADPSKTFEIGDTLTWILAVRDSRGLSTDVDPQILAIDLRTPDNSQIAPEIINKNGGNYVINFTAKSKGVYGLTVKFHGQHVRGSPYLLTCSSKQLLDGNSAKLHRQNITESLYLAANKAKELRDSSLMRHMQNTVVQNHVDDKSAVTYEKPPLDKHYKSNDYINEQDVNYDIPCRPSADVEPIEIIRNNINMLDIESTKICNSQTETIPHLNGTHLNHKSPYEEEMHGRSCSPTRKLKEAVVDLPSRLHSNHENIGSPHLSRAHQVLKTTSDKSRNQHSCENARSPTRKVKGIAESPPSSTFHGQHVIGSPRLARSNHGRALSVDKHNGKQSVENVHPSIYKHKNPIEEVPYCVAGSPPAIRAHKVHEIITDTYHGQKMPDNIHSPNCRRKELPEVSSPKFRRNTPLRNSASYKDSNSHGQQKLEGSHSPTCRRREIEISSPKLQRQYSMRNSSSSRAHQTATAHHRREQHTPSPTRRCKEVSDVGAKPCVYHSIGSPRTSRARQNYEIIDKPHGEESFQISHSPSCKRREIPSPNIPRQHSLSSSCSERPNLSRDVSPEKFIGRKQLENSYSSCDTDDMRILPSNEHNVEIPISSRLNETIETFSPSSGERDVENMLDSNYQSTGINELEPEKDEHTGLEKLCHSNFRELLESNEASYSNNSKVDDIQEVHKDNISVSSSCEATFGPVDNDLLIKIGRRGSKKGEFINLQGVCCTHDDKIVVADSNNQCVQVFDNEGNFLLRFGSRGRGPGQMQRPTGVAVTPTGNYLVADYENRWVNVFKPDGEYCKRFGSKKLLGPRGLTVTKDGNIIVVDNKASCLYIMQDNGKVLGKIGAPGCGKGRFSGPHYVALDTSNRLVITDFHNHQVHIFLLDGTHITTFGSNGEGNGQFNAPTGVAVDSQDNIIVADWGNNRLQVFDSSGSFLSFINTTAEPVFGPQDLALTNDGHVVVADSGNHCLKIYKYLQ